MDQKKPQNVLHIFKLIFPELYNEQILESIFKPNQSDFRIYSINFYTIITSPRQGLDIGQRLQD